MLKYAPLVRDSRSEEALISLRYGLHSPLIDEVFFSPNLIDEDRSY